MTYQIQVWPDSTATLMLNDGVTRFMYKSLEEAIHGYEDLFENQNPNGRNIDERALGNSYLSRQ